MLALLKKKIEKVSYARGIYYSIQYACFPLGFLNSLMYYMEKSDNIQLQTPADMTILGKKLMSPR